MPVFAYVGLTIVSVELAAQMLQSFQFPFGQYRSNPALLEQAESRLPGLLLVCGNQRA